MTAVTTKQKLTIHILPEAYAIVRKMVEVSHLECSMLGEVEKNYAPGIKFLITKIFIPFQTRSGTETTIDAGRLPEVIEAEQIDHQKVKCWFHSHVNMSPHPSGQDEHQISELMNDAEWFIRGIFNKKNEYTLSVHWMGIEIEATLEIYYNTETISTQEATTLLTSRTTTLATTYNYNSGRNWAGNTYYDFHRSPKDDYFRGSKKTSKKNKKKIKRLSLAEFLKTFPGKNNIQYLNYLKNNENDFELLEELEDEEIPVVKPLEVSNGEVVWQTV